MDRTSKRRPWSLLVVMTALFLLVGGAVAFASVSTDQPDYTPGSVVTISGDNSNGVGYLAGETVLVEVAGPNGYTATCEGLADEDGAWSCQVTLWEGDLAGGEYAYTATGETSGASESGTFTDGSLSSATLESRHSDCVTADSSFTTGNTVCVHTIVDTSGPSADVYIVWFNPSSSIAFTDTHLGVLDGSSINDSHAVTATGTWTVKACTQADCSPASSKVKGSTSFTVSAPADTTPPVITYSIAGTLGNNGWYVSDVIVTWSITDPESVVTIVSGCVDTTINYDTTGVPLSCSAMSAGGPASASVTIKRDATPPTITASVAPSRPDSGWWNITSGAPTVSFTCDDTTSSVYSCADPVTLGEGADQSVTGGAEDNAGNSASAGVSDIDVDLTAPTATITTPADDATYLVGELVLADFACSDALSGIASCGGPVADGAAIDTGPGPHTFSVTATDVAGNTGSASADYHALYGFNGFLQPVDNNGILNVAKAGRTIPLKWQVWDADGFVSSLSVISSLKTSVFACSAIPSAGATDPIESYATGGTVLRYDFTDNQFIFNWQTAKPWANNCYQVTLTLDDETTHSAYFQFTK